MQTDIKSFYCIVLWVPIEPLAVMSKMCVMTGVVMAPGEVCWGVAWQQGYPLLCISPEPESWLRERERERERVANNQGL